MSELGFVTLVIVIFFVIGIGVGVIAIVALAVTRRDRAARWAQLARRAPAEESPRRGPFVTDPAGDETGCDEVAYDRDGCDR